MRRALVGAILVFAVAAAAGASLRAPRQKPLPLEEAVNTIVDYWEVIFEGTIVDYEVITLPTPFGGRMGCTRITFEVERGIAGEPDSVLQAITFAFPMGKRPPPDATSSYSPDQLDLPMVGTRGIFFLHRAGRFEGWANNPARLVFQSFPGCWVENAGGVATYDVTEYDDTYDYGRFVAALEGAVHERSLSQLNSQAAFIAKVVVGTMADKTVTPSGDFQMRYPIIVMNCYRGALAPSPLAIVVDRSTNPRERYLCGQLAHERGQALIFGASKDSSSVTVLPGGVLTIDQQGMVALGLKAAGDTASVMLRPLASIEQQLQ